MECLRDFIWLLPAQTLMRTTPRAFRSVVSIRSYRRPTPFLETVERARRLATTSSTPVRRKRPATPPIRISKQPSPDWSINIEAAPLTDTVSDPALVKTVKVALDRRG